MRLTENPEVWLLSQSRSAVYLRLDLTSTALTGGKRLYLDFRLTHESGTEIKNLTPLVAESIRDALAKAFADHVEAIREGEYSAGYKHGRAHETKRNWAPCTLTRRIY